MDNWLIDKINLFKSVDFFKNETTQQAVTRIHNESDSNYFGKIVELQGHPLIDAIVLSFDKQTWFVEDWLMYTANHSIYPNYFEVIEKLVVISDGHFQPQELEIRECGQIEELDKLLSISYKQNEISNELVFCLDGSVLILSFLEEINEELDGYSFQYYRDPYGPCFIFFVTDQQKELLTFDFDSKSHYWLHKAQYFRDQKQPEVAEKCFQKAIKTDAADFPFIYSEYAYFLQNQGNMQKAKELLQEVITKLKSRQHVKKSWWQEQIEYRINYLEGI